LGFFALALVIVTVIGLQSFIYRKFWDKGLTYTCTLSKTEAFEGDEIELIETVENRKWLPLLWLKSEIITSRWLEFAGKQSSITDETRYAPSFFMLRGYQKVTRRWKVTCLRRGEFSLGRFVLVSSDVLGFATLSKPVQIDASIRVLPTPIDLEESFISPHNLYGDTIVKRHLAEDPFYISGVREYTERDPMNRVHWPATAKLGRLMVYNNDYTSKQSLTVILNMMSKPFESGHTVESAAMEQAIKTCAALFDLSLEQHMPIRFLANGCTTENVRETITTNEFSGEEHVTDLLRLLAGLVPHATEDTGLYLSSLADSIGTTDVALVSCYLDENMIEFARAKKRQGVHVRIYVIKYLDPMDVPEDCDVFSLYEDLKEDMESYETKTSKRA